MKKLFISCPMKGRTDENIRNSMTRMHKIAEAFFDQELEVIPTFIEDNPPENAKQALWYLGESIKKMSEADYYIGVSHVYEIFHGCWIENECAKSYGIPCTLLDIDMMPDALTIMQNHYTDMEAKRR